MFDAGARPYADNVRATRAAADWAHDAGLWVEAELGHVGGKPGEPGEPGGGGEVRSAHAAGVRTDPAQAYDYVAATGVDALAVAVGSSHAMRTRTARLDHGLIARLRDASPVPLVLHGSSGVPPAELHFAVSHGISKVNVGTAVGLANTTAVRAALEADPDLVDPRRYLGPARTAMRDAVMALLTALPSSTTGSRHVPRDPAEEPRPA
jgi:fructose-bisphosphate aldolase class II